METRQWCTWTRQCDLDSPWGLDSQAVGIPPLTLVDFGAGHSWRDILGTGVGGKQPPWPHPPDHDGHRPPTTWPRGPWVSACRERVLGTVGCGRAPSHGCSVRVFCWKAAAAL